MQPGTNRNSGFAIRFIKGALPIVIACILLSLTEEKNSSPVINIVIFAVSGLILWFGWTPMRRNVITKWLGGFLALYVALILGLFVLGVTLGLGLILLPVLLVGLPLLVYDLLFRAPTRDDHSMGVGNRS
jgi:hypothetical protein